LLGAVPARRGLTWRLFLRHTCILVSKVRSLRDFQGDSTLSRDDDLFEGVRAPMVPNTWDPEHGRQD
ncbi:hypothetical protein ACM0A3_11850, partial [Mycobacteroides abscessus subsp. abscessus]